MRIVSGQFVPSSAGLNPTAGSIWRTRSVPPRLGSWAAARRVSRVAPATPPAVRARNARRLIMTISPRSSAGFENFETIARARSAPRWRARVDARRQALKRDEKDLDLRIPHEAVQRRWPPALIARRLKAVQFSRAFLQARVTAQRIERRPLVNPSPSRTLLLGPQHPRGLSRGRRRQRRHDEQDGQQRHDDTVHTATL